MELNFDETTTQSTKPHHTYAKSRSGYGEFQRKW